MTISAERKLASAIAKHIHHENTYAIQQGVKP